MTSSVIDLSKRLQRSLDSNYNVIDLVAVFEIIRILEGTPITTEQLETTRLAKYINQLRRKTTNEQLARQAKNLLKKWRDNLMPAIASGSQAAAPAPVPHLSNGVRSQPTTPSRPVLQQQNHHSLNNHQTGSCDKSVIVIPDNDDNDSKSLGTHLLSSQKKSATISRSGCGSNSGSGVGSMVGGVGAGAGITIPTELTNFYLKNKKIIDGSDVRVVVPTKEGTPTPSVIENHVHSFTVDEVEPGDVDVRDRQKRKGRKKGSKAVDSLIGSTGSLFNSNSNSGFPGADATPSAVGKKVKTTSQLVADLKFRNEQNLRNASYPDLSSDQEHNNNNGLISSPGSSDSHQHAFHHHNHNQHQAGHDHMVFHSAPVTPSGVYGNNHHAAVKAEDGEGLEDAAAARRREKKRRKLEKEQAARLKVKKREKTPPPVSGLNFLNQVDEDIWQLKNKLPPIDRKAILRQMKAESLAEAEHQCTCEMVECSQEEAEKAAGVVYASLDDIPEPVAIAELSEDPPATADNSSSIHSSSAVNKLPAPSTSALPPTTVNVIRNKRSIFDDDDVVMDEAPSPAALDKNNNSEEERDDRSFPFPRQSHEVLLQPPPPVPVVIPAPPPLASPGVGNGEEAAGNAEEEVERHFYKFIEGSNCPVKRRKEDLLRLNPDYHLAALHQLYVPEVNGNWSQFPDLAILKKTQKAELRKLVKMRRATAALKRKQTLGRKRKRSTSDEDEEDDDEDEDDIVYSSTSLNSGGRGPDNSELIKCWERLQEQELSAVETVVPLVNPFFHFLKADIEDREKKLEPITGPSLLANMAGMLPRYVPLRSDYSAVVVPPEMPPPGEDGQPPPPPPPEPIKFNRDLAKELGIEEVCEGVRGDVYDPRELSKFLESQLRQRLPKFQMANLFYKRAWPGVEDRQHNLSLELLNSLYLNRVLEFRRRRRINPAVVQCGGGIITHRKRRRKSDDMEVEDGEDEEEEVEVNDVHVFDGFLEMQTRSSSQVEEGESTGSEVVLKSARRLFYVNDDRLFGHQPSILDDVLLEGGEGFIPEDPLPLLEKWDLFKIRWGALEFLPPVLSATARILYASWPRMRWNFLLDYFRDRQLSNAILANEDEEEGGEVIRIHENNFRLPSFNRLTEENLLGVRQRRGRRKLKVIMNGEEEGDFGEDDDEEENTSVLPERVQCHVESFRERDFIQVCMDKWPQMFHGIDFDYDKGLLSMQHKDVDTRWRFLCEFRDMLREATRLGVDGEEEEEDEYEAERKEQKNGFSSVVETEPGASQAEEVLVLSGRVRRVDEPQVELFKEWHESVQVQSYNDELLTILPYVVID